MTHEATRLAEEAKQALSEALSAAESSGHPLNHSRSRDADSARDECIAAIDALAALAQTAASKTKEQWLAESANTLERMRAESQNHRERLGLVWPTVSEEVERVAFEAEAICRTWAYRTDHGMRFYPSHDGGGDLWNGWLARAQSAAKGDADHA